MGVTLEEYQQFDDGIATYWQGKDYRTYESYMWRAGWNHAEKQSVEMTRDEQQLRIDRYADY